MKFKKIISVALLSATLVGGGLTHAKQSMLHYQKSKLLQLLKRNRATKLVANILPARRLKVVSKK